jgi:hypothetical protein
LVDSLTAFAITERRLAIRTAVGEPSSPSTPLIESRIAGKAPAKLMATDRAIFAQNSFGIVRSPFSASFWWHSTRCQLSKKNPADLVQRQAAQLRQQKNKRGGFDTTPLAIPLPINQRYQAVD